MKSSRLIVWGEASGLVVVCNLNIGILDSAKLRGTVSSSSAW